MCKSACEDEVYLTLELTPGGLSCGHLNDSTAHAPDVSLPAMAGLLDHLWGHPVGGALHALVARICVREYCLAAHASVVSDAHFAHTLLMAWCTYRPKTC